MTANLNRPRLVESIIALDEKHVQSAVDQVRSQVLMSGNCFQRVRRTREMKLESGVRWSLLLRRERCLAGHLGIAHRNLMNGSDCVLMF